MRNAIEHIDGRINTIGKRIKYFRVWLKETQEAFAPRMGVAKPTLVSYEHDNSRPDSEKLENLCNSVKNTDYQIDLNWFITGDGELFKGECRECGAELELRKRIDGLQQQIIDSLSTNVK